MQVELLQRLLGVLHFLAEFRAALQRLAYLVVIDVLAVGLALQRGPEFRKKMQNAQKALQEFDLQFDSFIG